MNENKSKESFYLFLNRLSEKWWFYILIFCIILVPPLSPQGFAKYGEAPSLIKYNAEFVIAKKEILIPYMPMFHIAIIYMFMLLIIRGNKFGRAYATIIGFHFLLICYQQGFAISDKYGIILYPSVLITLLVISALWFWEARIRKIDYDFKNIKPGNIWLIIAGIFSFWNPDTYGDYRFSQFLTSTSPIAFCMMYTIYMVPLSILYPKVNKPLFRIYSFLGILGGLIAIGMGFFMENRRDGIYWSLLHVPLLVVSVYSFSLGFKLSNEGILTKKGVNINK